MLGIYKSFKEFVSLTTLNSAPIHPSMLISNAFQNNGRLKYTIDCLDELIPIVEKMIPMSDEEHAYREVEKKIAELRKQEKIVNEQVESTRVAKSKYDEAVGVTCLAQGKVDRLREAKGECVEWKAAVAIEAIAKAEEDRLDEAWQRIKYEQVDELEFLPSCEKLGFLSGIINKAENELNELRCEFQEMDEYPGEVSEAEEGDDETPAERRERKRKREGQRNDYVRKTLRDIRSHLQLHYNSKF